MFMMKGVKEVRFSATMRPTMMYGKTSGLNAVKAAVSHHGRFFRSSAVGAEKQRWYGCISVPLSHFVGHAESAPVAAGPKPDGRYATHDNFRRVRGRRLSVTCGVSSWIECDAQMTRL